MIAQEAQMMTYLTSEQNFNDQKNAGVFTVYNPTLCYWDTDENACRFTGTEESSEMNGLSLAADQNTGPFSKVNSNTGFTINFEAKANGTACGIDARFFDGTIFPPNSRLTQDRIHLIMCKARNGDITDGLIALYNNYNNSATRVYINTVFVPKQNQWASYQVVVDHSGTLNVYIDGVQFEPQSSPTIVNTILSRIKEFELSIGNSPAGLQGVVTNFQFDGWIRNFQIASTDQVQRLRLKTSVANGDILANSVPLTTAGTLVPTGSTVTLQEEPAVGYHLDWSTVKYQNITTSDPQIGGFTATNTTFDMPNGITEVTGTFVQNQYTIQYDWNLKSGEEIVGDATTPANGTKSHFEGFLTASSSKMKRDTNTGWYYVLKGWTTNPASTTVEFEPGKSYAAGTATNSLNGTNNGDPKTLYAIWELKTYTVSVDPTISGGFVTVKKKEASGDGSNKVTGVAPDSKIIITTTIDTANDYIELKWLKRKDGNSAPVVIAGSVSGTDIAYQVDDQHTDPTQTYEITVGTEDIVISANFRGDKSVTLMEEVADGLVTVNEQEVRITANAVFIGKNANIVMTPNAHKRLTGFKWKYETDSDSDLRTVTNLTSYYSTATGSYTVPLSGLETHIQVQPTFSDKTELTGSTNPESLDLAINTSDQTQLWTGNPLTAGYTLTKGGAAPGENEYEVSFENNVDAGKAKGVVTMKNNEKYSGRVEFADVFTIKYNLAVASVQVSDHIYTSQSQAATLADVTVTLGNGTKVVDPSHYAISSVSSGTNVGNYDIVIGPSTNGYSQGSKSTKYRIVAADLSERIVSYTAAGTSDNMDVKTTATTIPIAGFGVSNVKLKTGESSSVTLDPDANTYRVAYVTADGQEYVGSIPANTFGKIYLAIKPAAGNANLVGAKLTDKYVSFQLAVPTVETEWKTYYNDLYNLELPSGYYAYVIDGLSTDNSCVEITQATYIPQGVPVLLHKNTGTYSTTAVTLKLDQAPTQAKPTFDARFMGVVTGGSQAVSALTSQGKVYVLKDGQFVETKSGTIPANRCYLLLSTQAGSRLRISADENDNATGIVDVLNDLQKEQWYDINGRSLEGPQGKGVYIVNGRKVIIK